MQKGRNKYTIWHFLQLSRDFHFKNKKFINKFVRCSYNNFLNSSQKWQTISFNTGWVWLHCNLLNMAQWSVKRDVWVIVKCHCHVTVMWAQSTLYGRASSAEQQVNESQSTVIVFHMTVTINISHISIHISVTHVTYDVFTKYGNWWLQTVHQDKLKCQVRH